jgi:hypothetical protein
VKPTIYFNQFGGGTILSLGQIERLASGKARIQFEGSQAPKSYMLNDLERISLEIAKVRGYCWTSSRKVSFLARVWHESNARPAVSIRAAGRRAVLEMDLVEFAIPHSVRDRWEDHQELADKVGTIARTHQAEVRSVGSYNWLTAPRGETSQDPASTLVALDAITEGRLVDAASLLPPTNNAERLAAALLDLYYELTGAVR